MSSGSKDWSRKRNRDRGDDGTMKSSHASRYGDEKEDNDNNNDEDDDSPQRSATSRSYYRIKNNDDDDDEEEEEEGSPTALSSARGDGGNRPSEVAAVASSRHSAYHPSHQPPPPHHLRGRPTPSGMSMPSSGFPPPYPMPPQMSGNTEHPSYALPHRGYDGVNGPPPPGYPTIPPHPYGVPPGYHYMAPYPMYPGYYPPHPMYGHPPHQQGPHYPYAPIPHDPSMARYPPESIGPDAYPSYGPPGARSLPGMRRQHRDSERKLSASANSSQSGGSEDEMGDEDDSDLASGAVTARLKTYIKPRIPSTQEVLDRRARKNSQSRARAAKLRVRIAEIEQKPEEDRTEEEMTIWNQYEQRRQRKNNRSRERALEKKEEIERIITKSDKKRSKIEKQFLETALSAKKRKNEGDRLRRQRLKELGLSTKGTGVKPGISARGPLPPQYQHLQQPQQPAAQHQQTNYSHMMHQGGPHSMGDIPMSPLPHHHPLHMHSPPFSSPGMLPGLVFPSPSGSRTPGRSMPYMPPQHEYGDPSPSQGRTGSQVVEQTRHPDGSISFSIDGRGSSRGATSRTLTQEDRGGVDNSAGTNPDGDGYGDDSKE